MKDHHLKILKTLVCAFCFLAFVTAHAKLPNHLNMQKIAQQFMHRHDVHGVAFIIHHQGHTYHFNFGVMNEKKQQPIDNETIFEIGSVTKTFTGVLLGIAVVQEKIKLSQTIKNFLPNDLKEKDLPVNQLTFKELATYTSGLPKNPGNYRKGRSYHQQQLWAFLKNWHPHYEPGKYYRYSNLSFGLLGYVIAASAGVDYSALLSKRLLNPLLMHHTNFINQHIKHYATGYTAQNKVAPRWQITAWRPASGALRSTPNDMAKFLRASLQTAETPEVIKKAMRVTQTPYFFKSNGQAVGLGVESLTCLQESRCWGKGGATAGFSTFILIHPENEQGVVVLTNKAGVKPSQVALAILERLQ